MSNEVGQKIINLVAGDNFNLGDVLLTVSNRMVERYNILCDTSGGGGAITIQFPTYAALSSINNFEVTITDTGNNAASNNITVLPGAGNTINQTTSVSIAANKGAMIVVMNGTNDWSAFRSYDPTAGAGTVTSFSSGNLSPLFTTNVANPTTTPALTFAQVVQEPTFVFVGPYSGSPANPTFRQLVDTDILMQATAVLDFGSTAAGTSTDLTIACAGAIVGDVVFLGLPASPNANSCFTAWVSASDTVKVRFNNYSIDPIDPASGTYRVAVLRKQ